MKLIITWLGYNEDFKISEERILENPAGFTGSIHKDIIKQYGFQKHVILCTGDKSGTISKDIEKRKKLMERFLKDTYPGNSFELADTGIDKEDLQNFPVIESSLRSFLQRFDAKDELHVVAGTGPTAVGMAWCTLNLAMENRFTLQVLQRPEYTPGGKLSTLREIRPYVSQLLDDKLREHHFNLELPPDIYRDEIVENEYAKARAYAKSPDLNVLLLGETGCGKDKMAEFIVQNSPLAHKAYRAINCASLQDSMLYTELFGHIKGAFTDAKSDRAGLFEECNNGTLFLDEIGDISPYMQVSLLRAIENKEIRRLGSNRVQKNINVRIIAATNNNLYQKCKDGKFRWDLYYRICNPEIELQPYRVRKTEQRKMVIGHFKKLLEEKWNRKISFSSRTKDIIETYSFPGNFREIYNTLNGLFPLDTKIIKPENLPARFFDKETELDESYKTAHRKHCVAIYEKYNFNLASSCKALGYGNSSQLKEKLKEWGVFQEEL